MENLITIISLSNDMENFEKGFKNADMVKKAIDFKECTDYRIVSNIEVLIYNGRTILYSCCYEMYRNKKYITAIYDRNSKIVYRYQINYSKIDEEEMIKIRKINQTSYKNETSWLSYEVEGKTGYEIVNEHHLGKEKRIEFLCNKNEKLYNKYADKNDISICSSYLQYIINMCLQSENEIFFVEYEDLEALEYNDTILLGVKQEVVDLNIQDVITFDEDECAITVGGQVLTRFLF
ncbi:hypothetical protein OD350_29365 (plasmid) [Clostridium beijerinckii]|uniref:hypothetical protein n=1 Tax=Clostridium beijerinckii TaxID=1520 RepID=UPI002226B8F7|nr:hypothetical protein [Clostridium beijerinckii]UYZ38999.1 hypothetical protein OD350_29365 [Clostridium beijerinckii]